MPFISEPLKVGKTQISHRVAMAPLTRFRATDAHVPTSLAAEYYSQRASVPGTMLITEATLISPAASGYPNVPGIWNAEQIAGWKEVTDAVHAKKSFIWLQLWALGRTAVQQVLDKEFPGTKVVSASARAIDSEHAEPQALSEEGIHTFIGEYAQAAKNAVEAGFDGVEIHGANGYLIDQFTQDVSNAREDAWGGSIEKRSRFAVEVSKAVVAAVGAERTGIRLSPFSTFQGMKMEDPYPQFGHLLGELKALKLAYVHLVESRVAGNADIEPTDKVDPLLEVWGKTSPVLLAGGFRPESAKRVGEEYPESEIVVVFGRYFISNPDLPFRVINGVELTDYNRTTFYTPKSPEGYTDYPFSEEFLKAEKGKL